MRHPECVSTLENLAEGQFQSVIDDPDVDMEKVRRVVFCSGKIYYDLAARKKEFNARDVALVRIEQLHPFPIEKVEEIQKKYKNQILSLWVQEEPINMGAWRHVAHYFQDFDTCPIARQTSGSPATGLVKIHQMQQEEIINKVFRKCVCDLNLKYCGLQCKDGSTKTEILKQYRYFLETENQ